MKGRQSHYARDSGFTRSTSEEPEIIDAGASVVPPCTSKGSYCNRYSVTAESEAVITHRFYQ